MVRIVLLVAFAALTVVVTPGARAQTVGAAPTFTAAERTTIHKWIKRQRPGEVRDLSIGAMLPVDVESYPVPKDWGESVMHYRYVHSGKSVYFVDPKSGRVVLRVD